MKRILTVTFTILFALIQHVDLYSQLNGKESERKKLQFEVSGGTALIHEHDNFYYRVSGTKTIIDQYAQYYQRPAGFSGENVKKIKTLVPLNLSLNYHLSKKYYLKIGFEYASGKSFTTQQYVVDWNGVKENFNYDYDYKISSLMPFVGFETRFSSFGLYTNFGFNITDFSFTQLLRYEEAGDLLLEEGDVFDTRGKSIALILGGKYMLKMGRKMNLLLKLEYLYLKINSFKGDKKNSGGTSSGTLYTYEINPYYIDWLPFWDLHEFEPNDPKIQDVGLLALDLSCFRITVGFTF